MEDVGRIEERALDGEHTQVALDRRDHGGHGAFCRTGPEDGRRVEAQRSGEWSGESAGAKVFLAKRADDGKARLPKPDGERAHVALGLPLRHGERCAVVQPLAREPLWLFPAASLATLVIAVVSIGGQAFVTAWRAPVIALRYK